MSSSQPNRWTADRIRREFITSELISGTVLVTVVIAIADESNGIFDVFAITLLSLLVFWVTDVFVHTVAGQRRRADNDSIHITASLRTALHEARGLLIAGIPPLIFLLLGLFGWNGGEFAYWIALWVEVAILFIAGWIAFGGRAIAWYYRLAGALATAALGILAVLLKIFIH